MVHLVGRGLQAPGRMVCPLPGRIVSPSPLPPDSLCGASPNFSNHPPHADPTFSPSGNPWKRRNRQVGIKKFDWCTYSDMYETRLSGVWSGQEKDKPAVANRMLQSVRLGSGEARGKGEDAQHQGLLQAHTREHPNHTTGGGGGYHPPLGGGLAGLQTTPSPPGAGPASLQSYIHIHCMSLKKIQRKRTNKKGRNKTKTEQRKHKV